MKLPTKMIIASAIVTVLGSAGVVGTSFAHDRGQCRGGAGDAKGNCGATMGRYFSMHHGAHFGYGKARGGHHQRSARMLKNFDSNADGKLTQAEIDQARQTQLSKFDSDGDGQLNLQEYQALWLDAMHERMVDRFQDHDADGDALVTAAEFNARFEDMVKRHDSNDDGELTADEFKGKRRHQGKMRASCSK